MPGKSQSMHPINLIEIYSQLSIQNKARCFLRALLIEMNSQLLNGQMIDIKSAFVKIFYLPLKEG